MNRIFLLPLLILSLTFSGCKMMEYRIGQDDVRQPVVNVITEDIRQASDYLSKNVIEKEPKEVSVALSQRVGSPKREITNPEQIERGLRRGSSDYQSELDDLNKWLEKRAGTKLEGTGINLVGVGGVALIIGLIVLLILVPAFIPIFISLIRSIGGLGYTTIKSTSKNIMDSIEEYKIKNPEHAKELKEILSKNMDQKEKTLVKKLKEKK